MHVREEDISLGVIVRRFLWLESFRNLDWLSEQAVLHVHCNPQRKGLVSMRRSLLVIVDIEAVPMGQYSLFEGVRWICIAFVHAS